MPTGSTPPPLPAGYDRFLFYVIDQTSGSPLADVCVTFTAACDASSGRTNSAGAVWFDIPQSYPDGGYTFRFISPNYLTATLNKTYRSGVGQSTTTVFLRHI